MALFDKAFQGGPSVEVFGTSGSNPLEKWKVSGTVHKLYDKTTRGYVFTCEGGPSTRMQIPKDERRSLGLVQPLAVLQLMLADEKGFSFEMQVTDVGHGRRRLLFSTSVRDISITPLHARIPLVGLERGIWLNLIFDLGGLVKESFGTKFARLDSITLSPSCCLRRICTLRDAPTLTDVDGSGETDLASLAPKGFELPHVVPTATHMFTSEHVRMVAAPEGTRLPLGPSESSTLVTATHAQPAWSGSQSAIRNCTTTGSKTNASFLPPPLQMHHIRADSAHDVLGGTRSSPGHSRRSQSMSANASCVSSPANGPVRSSTHHGARRNDLWADRLNGASDALHGSRPSRQVPTAPGSVDGIRALGGVSSTDITTVPQLEVGGEAFVGLSCSGQADGAAMSSCAGAPLQTPQENLQVKHAELQQRRRRFRQPDESFAKQNSDVACAHHANMSVCNALGTNGNALPPNATDGAASRMPQPLPLAPGRSREKLSGSSSPCGDSLWTGTRTGSRADSTGSSPLAGRRRPPSLAALGPEVRSSSSSASKAMVPPLISHVSLAQAGRKPSSHALLPSLRVDTTFDEGRASPRSLQHGAANTSPLAVSPNASRSRSMNGPASCGTPALHGAASRRPVPAIAPADGPKTLGECSSSPLGSQMGHLPAGGALGGGHSGSISLCAEGRDTPSGQRIASSDDTFMAAATIPGAVRAEGIGSDSGADDEADSGGESSEDSSEAGSLAAARELGFFDQEWDTGRGVDHGSLCSANPSGGSHPMTDVVEEDLNGSTDGNSSSSRASYAGEDDGRHLGDGSHAHRRPQPPSEIPPPSASYTCFTMAPTECRARCPSAKSSAHTSALPSAQASTAASSQDTPTIGTPSTCGDAPWKEGTLPSGDGRLASISTTGWPGCMNRGTYNPDAYIDEQSRSSSRHGDALSRGNGNDASSPPMAVLSSPSPSLDATRTEVARFSPVGDYAHEGPYEPRAASAVLASPRVDAPRGLLPPAIGAYDAPGRCHSTELPPLSVPSSCSRERSIADDISQGFSPRFNTIEDFSPRINGAMDGRAFTPPILAPATGLSQSSAMRGILMSRNSRGRNPLPFSTRTASTSSVEVQAADSEGAAELQPQPGNAAGEGEGDELDLMFDPILNCYYDPKTNKYYQLAY